MALVGWAVLIPTGLAMLDLRLDHPWWLLGMMCLVWVADISAYFAGRKFGKNKLAPSISPGKTWEGVVGAMLGVSVCIVLAWSFSPYSTHIALLPSLLLASWCWVGLAVIGDLFESAIKRQAGVKDSGALLPGHGGLLDRIDALTSTLAARRAGDFVATSELTGHATDHDAAHYILGSTGSIGTSTLDVVARHPDKFRIVALTANSQVDLLFRQCQQFKPRYAVLLDEAAAIQLRQRVREAGLSTEVLSGMAALEQVVVLPEVDAVMAAIVGAAGLRPTLAAAHAGKKILLANKETLVMAGNVFMDAVRASGSMLLPIDSEHNAIFQALPRGYDGNLAANGVRRILLTASGGPFRNTPLGELHNVTPEQACAHPNWVMGRKISVDSASMMNKGLEVIEAHWLFNASADDIQVVIHPQSVIHSLVEYVDGSVLAQLGNPDMRTPIAYGLAYPERIDAGVAPLDLFKVATMNFVAPDFERFPCLALAYQALRAAGTAPAVLNAANEVAVAAFLDKQISFLSIPRVIEAVLDALPVSTVGCLDDVLGADAEARRAAQQQIQKSSR